MRQTGRSGIIVMLALSGALGTAWPQVAAGPSWPGCADLRAGDFRRADLAVNHPASPTKMKIAEDGKLYFAEMGGTVWMHDPSTQATKTLGKVSVLGGGVAFGLVGLALDPAFARNGWIYLLYSAKPVGFPAAPISYQLWRHSVANGILDPAAGKLVLEYPADRGAFPVDHSGGGMAFDGQGNLYIATGENSDWNLNYGNIDETRIEYNSLRTAGNTNDLRGKVLRIHPEPDGRYTIPAGNLFPPGRDSTRAEIYAMGFRNPWSLEVDHVTGTVVWADVGPQAATAAADKGPAGMDEFNATRTPGFFGWPMFMGPNLAYNNYDYAAREPGPFFDEDAPVNASRFNTGLRLLPPARPSTLAYGKDGLNNPWPGFARGEAVPITGPVYRYEGKNPSRIKLPPHFEGHWFIADAFQKWIRVVTLDAGADKALAVTTAFPGLTYASTSAYSIIAMAFGPDGALYVCENGSKKTFRIEYTGTCLPDVTPSASFRHGHPEATAPSFLIPPGIGPRKLTLEAGRFGISLFDLQGRKVWTFKRSEASAPESVDIPAVLGGAMLRGLAW